MNDLSGSEPLRGYGKIILFGEHAVVYGYPALAAALSTGIIANAIQPAQELTLVVPQWQMQITAGHSSSLGQALAIIATQMQSGDLATNCAITLTAEIPSEAGLGSSAACAVAIIKAILHWNDRAWEPAAINALAFAAEKVFHGTPSGIDNTIASYGGMCYLGDAKRFPFPAYSQVTLDLPQLRAALLPPLAEPVSVVVVNTKVPRQTRVLVARVRELLATRPTHARQILEEIAPLALEGYQLLCQRNYQRLGELMDCNHHCLQQLEVSCPKLDLAVACAKDAGALGAKLTGAGGGGCLLALAPGREPQIIAACRRHHFEAFVAQIN